MDNIKIWTKPNRFHQDLFNVHFHALPIRDQSARLAAGAFRVFSYLWPRADERCSPRPHLLVLFYVPPAQPVVLANYATVVVLNASCNYCA